MVLKTDFSDVAHTIVCFANACGGKVLIGIEDHNETTLHYQRSNKWKICLT